MAAVSHKQYVDELRFVKDAYDLSRKKAIDLLTSRSLSEAEVKGLVDEVYGLRAEGSDTERFVVLEDAWDRNDLKLHPDDYIGIESEGIARPVGGYFFDEEFQEPEYPVCLVRFNPLGQTQFVRGTREEIEQKVKEAKND